MPDLLIELFSEEIPARMQVRAAEDLKKLVTNGLVEAGLTYVSAGAFSTPRRLTLSVESMSDTAYSKAVEKKGPPLSAPRKAIAGFLAQYGIEGPDSLIDDFLQTLERGEVITSGDTFFIRATEVKGRKTLFAVDDIPVRQAEEIVAEVLEQTIRQFPWPKSMRWGTGSLRWVRPLQAILCILFDEGGARVVDMSVDGIAAADKTKGHRFMAPDAFSVSSFEDYSAKLKRAHVMLDAGERADAIWHDATNLAFASGLEVVEDRGLLAEVAGLVEWPVVLMGSIGDTFLDLPPEVLQTSMKEHQKFFSVRNPKTGRIEKFITVANRETADQGATILAGNEKVLSARLSDAKFFWENDLRTVNTIGLEGMAKPLADVTFHNKLGSQAERVARIEALAREIAPMVGAKPDLAAEAARIAKADLASEMVYEFPELQGVMGKYYAAAAGHDDGVPEACAEHYSPLGPSDDVPTGPVSVTVALADKIDTLTGFWAIDEKPTGSKDPYALRRAALGVIRLVLDNKLSLSLLDAFQKNGALALIAMKEFGNIDLIPDGYTLKLDQDLLSFVHDRLKVYLRDQGIRHDIIDACIAMPGNDDLALLVNRAEALSEVLVTEDGENLIQGFKRANNIVTQAEEADGVEYSYGADVKWAETDEERALFAALDAAEAKITPAMAAQDFGTAMHAMAGLRGPIDAFFEAVKINADNETVRRNRLNLLSRIRTICLSVADLTKVETR